jgi:hypothetical protein
VSLAFVLDVVLILYITKNLSSMVKLHHGIHSPTRASISLTLDLNLSRPPSDVKGLTNALMAGCQRKAMGRTVGSQITMVHLFNLSVARQLSRAKDIKPWINTSLTGCTHSPSKLPKNSRNYLF